MALVEKEAGIIVPNSDLDQKLVPELKSLIDDEQRQQAMGENIRQLARPDATEKIVDEVIKLLEI